MHLCSRPTMHGTGRQKPQTHLASNVHHLSIPCRHRHRRRKTPTLLVLLARTHQNGKKLSVMQNSHSGHISLGRMVFLMHSLVLQRPENALMMHWPFILMMEA